MKLQGRKIYPGLAEGEALVSSQAISFFGGVDPDSGLVVERGHPLEGQSVAGKILVFPTGKGSTVGSYTLYRLKHNRLAPLAILNAECETITAVGCIIAEIPCLDQVDIRRLQTGQRLRVEGEAGTVTILRPPGIPPPLCGSEPGSFAEDTLSRRLPGIVRGLLADGWEPPARAALQALADEMPHAPLRPLLDDGGPDLDLWVHYMPPYLGLTWLEAPWFAAEVYFFRRILEASGYFQPGAGRGRDPYRRQKEQGRQGLLEQLAPLCASLEATPQPAGAEPALDSLARLLHTVVWGNQADLSVWPVGGAQPDQHTGDQRAAHLLADHTPQLKAFLRERPGGLGRVEFILDNVGLELAYDLLLADFLLAHGLSRLVVFQAKPFPTYVSDATIPDILELMEFLAGAGDPPVSRLGRRLREHLSEGRLLLKDSFFWITPLAGWDMPEETRQELAEADLLVSKGDANYRRWLGDRHWPFTTPIQEILAYHPAPLLLLRVLKAEIIAGLEPGQPEALSAQEPDWLYNGRWGLIQFVP